MASFPIPSQDGAYPRMPGQQHKPVSMSQVQGFGFESDLEKQQREQRERREQRKLRKLREEQQHQQELQEKPQAHPQVHPSHAHQLQQKQLPRPPQQLPQQQQQKPLSHSHSQQQLGQQPQQKPLLQKQLPHQPQQQQQKPLPHSHSQQQLAKQPQQKQVPLPQKQLPQQPQQKQLPHLPKQLPPQPQQLPPPHPNSHSHPHPPPPPRQATLNRKPSMNPLISPSTHQQSQPQQTQSQPQYPPKPAQPPYLPASPSVPSAVQSSRSQPKFYPGHYGQQNLPGQPTSFPQQQQHQHQQTHPPLSPVYGQPAIANPASYHQPPTVPHSYSAYGSAPVSPSFASPSSHQFREPTLPQLLPQKKPVASQRTPRPDIPELQSGDVPSANPSIQELQSDVALNTAPSAFVAELDCGMATTDFIAEMPGNDLHRLNKGPDGSGSGEESSSVGREQSQDAAPLMQANPWGFFLEDNPAIDPQRRPSQGGSKPVDDGVFEADSTPVKHDSGPGPVELADSTPPVSSNPGSTTTTTQSLSPKSSTQSRPEPLKGTGPVYESIETPPALVSPPAKSPGKFIPFRPGVSPTPSPGLPSASPGLPQPSPPPSAQNAPIPPRRPSLASPPASAVSTHPPPPPECIASSNQQHQGLKYRPSMPNMHIGTPSSPGLPPPLPSPAMISPPAYANTFPSSQNPSPPPLPPPPPYTPMESPPSTHQPATPALPPRPSTSHNSSAPAFGFGHPNMPQYPPPPHHPSLANKPQHLSSSSTASSSSAPSPASSCPFTGGRQPRTAIGEASMKLLNSKAVKMLTSKASNIIETHVSPILGTSADGQARSTQSPQQTGVLPGVGAGLRTGRSASHSYSQSRG
ncbi:hypothetical protein HOO65_030468 [Ceratocystis lukuohia]|uniref:Uncharacterized protein n=1 Tax=Ceratocystis lukuohia TaxID=2019550 RepID=A0ABR4ML07_9PEZI